VINIKNSQIGPIPLIKKIEFIEKHFNNLTTYLELEDFRAYLLLSASGFLINNKIYRINQDIVNLNYDPYSNIFFQTVRFMSAGVLVLYVKYSTPEGKMIIEKNDTIITKFLTETEIRKGLTGIKNFAITKRSYCGSSNDGVYVIEIENLYHDMQSFVYSTRPHLIFVIESKQPEPDILFTFTMNPNSQNQWGNSRLKINAYLDHEYQTRRVSYIKSEGCTYSCVEEVSEINHAEAHNHEYVAVIRIKSFNQPDH